jgi:hypothetical protein
MKTNEEVYLMIARIEGRIEGTNLSGGDSYSDKICLTALLWVMGEVEKL